MKKAAAHTHQVWRWIPGWQRLLLVACACAIALVQLGGSRAAVSNATIGDWSAPIAWPLVAVHMSLEPTGQVFMLDGFDDGTNSERLWDPASGSFLPVPYGRNLFCAGHIQLADGRTLLVGGHINANEGLADTTIFNPSNNTYFRGPDMSVGRWYPTATQLPDGRVLTFGGDNIIQDRPGADPPFSDASVDSLPSVYNPTTNTWTDLTAAKLTSPLYPNMFVLSDGRVFNAGPDKTTRILNPATSTWSTVGTSPFDGHSAVMYRPNKIMKAGAWADPDFNGALTFNSHGRTAVIDMSAGTPTWRETAPMANGRSYHNLTLLPDGTVLASGGGSKSDGRDIESAVLPAEIWNPDTETWTTVDSLQNGRLYHSTALLLPDGRVVMAGGGQLPGSIAVNQKNAEIYSPPYLFKGPRPTISSAPSSANYGSSFDVTTPNAGQIANVSLIRLPSVTHAFDQNQRFQFLSFTAGAGKVTVQAPANANLAPPGDYMLFLVDTNGVPSVASFVRVSAAADTTPPTAPTNLSATAGAGQVALSWTAATDDVAVARYNVHRGTTAGFTPSTANRIAQPAGTSYTNTGLSAGTYYYKVTAEDAAGNIGPVSNEANATVAGGGPPPGLVAAWGFDEGSGTTTTDRSGNGNAGTLSNTTWSTTGKFGNALSFNGTDAYVSAADSNSLDLTTGMTIEGWVQPNAGGGFRTLIVKERPGDLVYGLYSNSDTNRPQSQVTVSPPARLLDGTATVPTGLWTHLAATFDGTTQRLFANGTQVAQVAVSGSMMTSTSPVKIGGNAIWGEWFSGLIDEVRVYNRALSATEIQTDMNTSISAPDTTPPSAPGTLSATGGLGQVSLSWGAATDNVGVVRYNVHRSTTAGFTPSTANRIAQPTGTSYTNTGLAAATYHYKVTAEDAGGNVGPAGNEASGTATSDTTPPTAPTSLTATGASGQVSLTWGAATDAGGVARYNVHRGTTAGFTPSTANRVAQPAGTSYTDTGLAAGTYYYRVTAEDNAGNVGPASNEANATVPIGPPAGLVAAYGFDAGSGTTAADQSGNGNTGTVSNTTWSTTGKFGNALSFNGTNSSVSIPDSSSLDLTTGMTIEGWVQPAVGGGWQTLIVKERPGDLVYGLYSNSDTNRPQSQVTIGGNARLLDGTAAVPTALWTHLAATYDGTTQRLYANGTQMSQLAIAGTVLTSNSPVKIGGNAIWPEWFNGLIDEVRIYNRALSATEIQADMNISISSPDAVPPSAPGTLTATGALTSVQLSWGAATDNVGVVRYNVHRGTNAGFAPSTANRIAQPTGTGYTDTVAGGTYYYSVTAEDAAGNVGPASNEASATVATDTTAPSAPSALTGPVTGSTVNLSWTASTDNVGVARYNVHRGTSAGFTPSTANRIAQPTGTSHADTGLATGTYFYKVTAEDAAGNISAGSNEISATVVDASAPTAPTGLTASVVGSTINLTWTAATDNVGVVRYNVHRGTTVGFTPSTANRIAQPTGTSYANTGLSAGTYYYKVTAEDAAGNIGPASNEANATVAGGGSPPGLVAALGFDEGSGTTTVDQSGNGNAGTLSNTTWSTTGKFGNALSFNGTNSSVSVADSNSLDLTTGLTIEGWVRPAVGGGWQTMIVKERPNELVYGLYSNSDTNRPQSQVTIGGTARLLDGTAAVPTALWTHLAATFDGTTQRLYANGSQVSQLAIAGSIMTSNSPVKIGGNAIWSEWFTGLIDEVRIYNRALSAAEIQADMNQSISSPDTIPPSAPGTLTATGGLGQIGLSWGAATDDVTVARYNVHRSTTAAFTPSTANRIAQPTGTSYTNTGLTAGTYYYKVTAEDAAGNVGPPGNEASATATADTTPPTVSITSPVGGATVSASVNVNANAFDNGTVAGVQFKLDGANIGTEDTTAPYSISWDTFGASNGSHTLTAVARDGAGNLTTSAGVAVNVQNTGSSGLVGAWAFDEGSGTTAGDQSGRGNGGTLTNATWVTGGKFNGALSFNGTNAWVTVVDNATLDLTTGMTVEAWLRPSAGNTWQTAIAKEQPGNLAYGLYSNTNANRPQAEVFVNGSRATAGTSALATGTWSHLAATYDGTTLRLYVNGAQVTQLGVAGSINTSNSPVRIGGNSVWGEYFNGLIDEVRIYNRALSATEIQNDMVRSITPDTVPPTVAAKTPTDGAAGLNVGVAATAAFNEPISASSITSSTFLLKDPSNVSVPTNVTYNSSTNVATLTPQSALQYGATYTLTVKGGAGGVTDLAGNPLGADASWSFTTEASPPQVLVVGWTGNPFGAYLGEILRNEGLNAFTTIDVAFVSPSLLSGFDVVLLGDTPLSGAQVSALTGWVDAGGNLIAMRPDKQLAGLLGLTDAGTSFTNAYLQVDTSSAPGAGIVGSTIQFHGAADRYTLSGATAVATLYSNATTATSNPAVTLRPVGSNGGQAAAFTFDLARSVVYTRQGNPAWAGQERDGVVGIRPSDMFFGGAQTDWIDTNKIAIPQADEQQRLLLNLITHMERDRMPLPHFWYLPRGEKAAVVMSGDDHSPSQAPGGTAVNFDRFKQLSPPGCVVANWDCIRSSSYIYPNSTLTNAQAAAYLAEGFEIGLHPVVFSCPTAPISEAELAAYFDTQLASWRAKYTSQPGPASSRTHCVFWPDWVSNAKVQLARGIRMDANYYHFPGSWIGAKNGFMTGGGFPMRFAEIDGTLIDAYQGHTHLTDESTSAYATAIAALLDNAVGTQGYYGAFGMNMHTDASTPHPGAETIVLAAQARSVPVISYKQLLDWTDGRNSSTIRGLSWSAGALTFVTTVGAGANGLQTLLPTQGPTGTLSALTCGGSPRAFTLQTIKGIQYAMFDTITGTCQATYS